MQEYQFTKIRQAFERPIIQDIEATVQAQINAKLNIAPGARIAIAVGSRGVANIARVAKATVAAVRAKGGEPFIVPAMGSHGGATAEGQREILATYDVTEEVVGCPIRATMEAVELDSSGLELSVFMDKFAFESDGVILINRIKPHTAFHGDYESGLIKMSVIGLGKQRLALELHSYGMYGLKTLMPQAGKRIMQTGKILLGLGLVENAYDETAIIEALTPEEILTREPQLLALSKTMMPSLPLDEIDALIVDRLGKNISGSGMDPNIIGRMKIKGEPEIEKPQIKAIVVTDITDVSHGNACGVGLADVTTKRLLKKVDWDVTYTNSVASGFYEHSMLPVVAETDAQALDWALRACHDPNSRKKIMRITDTLHLSEMYVSDVALNEICAKVEILSDPMNLFDEQGALIAF